MDKPTLGVLITYYNEKELLTECLESLLTGTELPDEILVYDDCSQYPAQDYVPDNPLIRVIRGEKNGGMIHGRKQLLQMCDCDYLHFHDSDDLFAPRWAEQVRKATESADFIVTRGLWQHEDGTRDEFTYLFVVLDSLRADFQQHSLRYGLNTLTTTFHKSLVPAVLNGRGDDLGGTWDYYSNALLAHAATSFQLVDEPLFIVRKRAGSMSRGTDNRERPDTFITRMKALTLLLDDLPHRRDLLVELITMQAARMYKRGMDKEAAAGFKLAHQIGRPTYAHQSRAWRSISHTFGPMATERLFALYTRPTLVKLRGAIKNLVK